MFDCDHFRQWAFLNWVEVQEGATDAQLEDIQQILGYSFPGEYVALLKCSNGFVGPLMTTSMNIYAADELQEQNETFQVKIYAPASWLMIGDDGGGQMIMLDCADGSVYRVGDGYMRQDGATILAPDLSSWIDQDLDTKIDY